MRALLTYVNIHEGSSVLCVECRVVTGCQLVVSQVRSLLILSLSLSLCQLKHLVVVCFLVIK